MGYKWMGKPVEEMDREELLNVVNQLAKRLEIERMTKATTMPKRMSVDDIRWAASEMGMR